MINEESLLTSHQVGSLLQVTPATINNWVKDGRLPAFRTPGGHIRIRASELISFLVEHEMPVPSALNGALKKRVLLADDDEKVLKALKRSLNKYRPRVEVQTTSNGVDALVMVGSFRPDLVLLDVFMPGIDGIDVCKRLGEMSETKSVSVVVTSGRLTKKIEKRALAAGARAVWGKPFSARDILDELGMSQSLTL